MNFRSMEEFWPFYMNQHSKRATRRWHFAGTICGILWLIYSMLFNWWCVIFVPLFGYGLAWYSHFFVERNVPASFGHPIWSLLCDFKMFGLMLTGQMDREIKRLESYREVLPFTTMLAMEDTNSGLNTFFKFTTSWYELPQLNGLLLQDKSSFGSSSLTDWNTGSSMLHCDYTNIDWSLDLGALTLRTNGFLGGGNYDLQNKYDSLVYGLGMKSAMRPVVSSGNGGSILGLQEGVVSQEPSGGSSRDWTSPFEEKDPPGQFGSSPSL